MVIHVQNKIRYSILRLKWENNYFNNENRLIMETKMILMLITRLDKKWIQDPSLSSVIHPFFSKKIFLYFLINIIQNYRKKYTKYSSILSFSAASPKQTKNSAHIKRWYFIILKILNLKNIIYELLSTS